VKFGHVLDTRVDRQTDIHTDRLIAIGLLLSKETMSHRSVAVAEATADDHDTVSGTAI